MNIVLIGMMGSGKTTVGRLLAKNLNKHLLEIDEMIEDKIREKIAGYVVKNGWEKFRDCEKYILLKAANSENSIISCGGGVVEKPENIVNLKGKGFLIYLSASIETLYKRIGKDKSRPLLTKTGSMKADLANIFKKRKNLYEKSADLVIGVDNKTVLQITDEIINALNGKKLL